MDHRTESTMDCQQAREMLDAARPDRTDWHAAEVRAAAAHAAECDECRVAMIDRARFDALIADVMSDVKAPDGLMERLLSALASEESPVRPESAPPRRVSRRTWALVAAASLVLAVGAWFLRIPRAESLSLEELYTRLDQELLPADSVASSEQHAFDGRFETVPADPVWQDALEGSAAIGLTLDSRPGDDAAAYRFERGRLRGWLVVIPRDRLSAPPAASQPVHANYRYGPRPQVAWSSGGNVYVCILDRGTLDELNREFYGSAV